MSYQGINFANQRLVPSDDGRLYQKIFNDGALYGCELSYSGAVLFLSPGFLIIGGREIELDAAEQIAINEAISGFAQLVISIDLTQTATKDTFNQISMSVRYAAAEDGFATLVQDDINGSGSRYEAQLALVSLGAGGITGIVEDMPQAAFRGSAGAINLKVVGGLDRPAAPQNNTVWVMTEDDITGYAVSSDAPADAYEGLVWLDAGTSTSAPINVGGKDPVMIYPTACAQCVGGVWVSKVAETYIDGQWIPWKLWLIESGVDNTALTGGWLAIAATNSPDVSGRKPTISFSGQYMSVTQNGSGSNNAGVACTALAIDLSGKTTLTAVTNISQAGANNALICIWSDIPSGSVSDGLLKSLSVSSTTDAARELDISDISGPCYIGLYYYQYNGGTAKISDIRVE